MIKVQDTKFFKLLLFVNSLVPLTLLGWDALRHRLGANPLEFVTRTTGMLTLIFLLLSLVVTPLRKLSGWNWLGKFRRMVGLYAFFYALLHFLTYVWFDRFFNLKSIVLDTLARPFIAVGMACFFILIPLAVTSTNGMVKRLGGRRWNRLHKAVYVAGALGVLHFYMLVKSDTRLPIAFAIALALLLGYRIAKAYMPPPNPKTSVRTLIPPR
ncbi:MAG TPA: protein-methionine-sulfoxide reductase heme-binding subunit MsrQ [Pyrinomonadaceae bacterium]|jgi:sulfoxide reductase heme-binding subunit YedZ